MSEEDPRERRSWKTRIAIGGTVSTFLIVGLGHTELLASLRSVTAGLLGASPGNALRVLQSVGILLPLFTGLLRFTTSDQSSVNDRVNEYLLLGIVALVLAGVFATVAGTLTETTIVVKISLLFVLFAFTIIGFAAVMVFKGLDDPTDTSEPETSESEEVADETQPEAKTERPETAETGNDEIAENESGIESNRKNERGTESSRKDERDKAPSEPAGTQSAVHEDDEE